jgi:alpha-glucosidase
MDVIHCIGKDPALPDVPAERAIIPACALNDVEPTHGRLRDLRRLLDSYAGERVMVGEVGLPWTEKVAPYYGRGDELHLAFNFPPLFAPWEAGAWRERIADAVAQHDPRGAWPTWVLSNHDNRRHRTRWERAARRCRGAAAHAPRHALSYAGRAAEDALSPNALLDLVKYGCRARRSRGGGAAPRLGRREPCFVA